MVGETGFEPATLWSQTRCATRLRYSPTGGLLILGCATKQMQQGAAYSETIDAGQQIFNDKYE